MITLAPLPAGRADLIADLSLPPEQHQFSDPPAIAYDQAEGRRDGHVIRLGDQIVGFFGIDPDYPDVHDFATPGSIGLRMFSVDQHYQGRGIASATCGQLKTYLAHQYPGAPAVYLTVNHRNQGAKRAYLNGGFTDTGADYLLGGSGPQHIMRLDLQATA